MVALLEDQEQYQIYFNEIIDSFSFKGKLSKKYQFVNRRVPYTNWVLHSKTTLSDFKIKYESDRDKTMLTFTEDDFDYLI